MPENKDSLVCPHCKSKLTLSCDDTCALCGGYISNDLVLDSMKAMVVQSYLDRIDQASNLEFVLADWEEGKSRHCETCKTPLDVSETALCDACRIKLEHQIEEFTSGAKQKEREQQKKEKLDRIFHPVTKPEATNSDQPKVQLKVPDEFLMLDVEEGEYAYSNEDLKRLENQGKEIDSWDLEEMVEKVSKIEDETHKDCIIEVTFRGEIIAHCVLSHLKERVEMCAIVYLEYALLLKEVINADLVQVLFKDDLDLVNLFLKRWQTSCGL